jgi:hypothetical protein
MCQSLTQTVPASSWAATSRARWLSVLQTPADSPYSVSLAIRIAWSVLGLDHHGVARGQRGHRHQRPGPLEAVAAGLAREVTQVGDGEADLEGPGLATLSGPPAQRDVPAYQRSGTGLIPGTDDLPGSAARQ